MENKPSLDEKTLYQGNPSMFRNHPLWYVGNVLWILLGLGVNVVWPDYGVGQLPDADGFNRGCRWRTGGLWLLVATV